MIFRKMYGKVNFVLFYFFFSVILYFGSFSVGLLKSRTATNSVSFSSASLFPNQGFIFVRGKARQHHKLERLSRQSKKFFFVDSKTKR